MLGEELGVGLTVEGQDWVLGGVFARGVCLAEPSPCLPR